MKKILSYIFLFLTFGSIIGYFIFPNLGTVSTFCLLSAPLLLVISGMFSENIGGKELKKRVEQSYNNLLYNGLSDKQRRFIFSWSWRAFLYAKFLAKNSPLVKMNSVYDNIAVRAGKSTRQLVWEKTGYTTFDEYLTVLRKHEEMGDVYSDFWLSLLKKLGVTVIIIFIVATAFGLLMKYFLKT